MLSSLLQRPLCTTYRLSYISQQSCRNISARSAINKGLRATQGDGKGDRGGRDRSKGFAPRSGFSRTEESPAKRASLSQRVQRADRELDRKSQARPQRSRSFDGERPRRARLDDSGEKSFSPRSRDATGFRPRSTDSPKSFGSSRPRETSGFRSRPAQDSASSEGFRSRTSRNSESFGRRPSRDDSGFRSRGPRESKFSDSARFKDKSEFRPRSSRSTETEAEVPTESSEKSKGGILREIKTACKLIETIQQRQASGDGVDGLTLDTRASLARINSLATSGTFREDPADAIADLLRKKAADGTFIRGRPQDDELSVIFQKRDGTLDLAIGRGGPIRSAKSSRESDREERPARNTKPDRSDRYDRPQSSFAPRQRRAEDGEDDGIPVSIPYTTAASEFLYGYNSVLAALKAQRRKMYKLYIHPKIFEREFGNELDHSERRSSRNMPAHEFVSLAKEAKVPFRNEFNTRILDKMSDGRPHNGLVLEVSKLAAPPVVSLGKPNLKEFKIPLTLGKQTSEEAAVNGSPSSIPTIANSWRYPLVVLLDGITDPGNVGNILRTCHFYGVDAVAVAVNTCANLSSAVLAKASSGACEAVRILSVSQPSNFIFESSKFRWKVFAAVAPTSDPRQASKNLTTAALAADSPLAKHPCILMLGAEGEGLRENLKNRADHFISIAGGSRAEDAIDVGVDSMNVSVAAGVLLESFLRKPDTAPKVLDVPTELGF